MYVFVTFFCGTRQPSVPSETKRLSKTLNPVIQESNSGRTKMEDTKTMTTLKPYNCYPFKLFSCAISRKHTLICRSDVQVQDIGQHIIVPIHKHTPSRWHKDNIQAIRGRSILFWHIQWGLWKKEKKKRLHLSQHCRKKQVMIS